MICKKCGGSYEGWCKLCDMFAAQTPPGAEVQQEAVREDRPRISEREFARPRPVKRTGSDWQVSEALACHPTQVSQMNARNKKHGVATRYDKLGFAHIPSRGDRKKLLKLESGISKQNGGKGVVDKSGGYGD